MSSLLTQVSDLRRAGWYERSQQTTAACHEYAAILRRRDNPHPDDAKRLVEVRALKYPCDDPDTERGDSAYYVVPEQREYKRERLMKRDIDALDDLGRREMELAGIKADMQRVESLIAPNEAKWKAERMKWPAHTDPWSTAENLYLLEKQRLIRLGRELGEAYRRMDDKVQMQRDRLRHILSPE